MTEIPDCHMICRRYYDNISLLLISITLLCFPRCQSDGSSYAPEEALQTFELPEGYRIELVVSEPDIRDPIAMAFDASGRLFVVEMPTYPISDEWASSIKLLEDPDGDGRYEESTVFEDSLHFPHGVMPWKDGILVPDAPNMLYLADTTGDNRADVRKKILSGFARVNPQLRANTPIYGLDNWIYVAYPKFGPGNRFPKYSDLGEPLYFPGHPEAPTADPFSKGMDFRFKPDELKVQAVSGNAEYGLTFNARSHRFTSWNDRHARHVVIENKYLERNPYLVVGSAMEFIPDHGSPAAIYPITAQPHLTKIRRASKANRIGTFTSACGQSVYTGGHFSQKYQGAYFVCDPVNNLVHSDILLPSGATYVAKRAREEKAFLASTDLWFRPVFTTIGPDGALYVVDFYRKIVEHPEFIRRDFVDAYELFNKGKRYGRIYRIVYEGADESVRKPNLDEATGLELVQELSNLNRWWRITAQRLLVERQDTSVIPALEELVMQGVSPAGRMHALWTLEGLDVLSVDLVVQGLEDESPMVREQAIRLAENMLSDARVIRELLQMVDDPDSRVQFQLSCTLGELPPEQSFTALKRIDFQHIDDPWFQTAILTSASETAPRWFRTVMQDDFFSEGSDEKAHFLQQITSIIGAKQDSDEIVGVLAAIRQHGGRNKLPWWQMPSLDGLSEGLRRGTKSQINLSRNGQDYLLELIDISPPKIQQVALDIAAHVKFAVSRQLKSMVTRASDIALSKEAGVESRVIATRILGLLPRQSIISTLEHLLTPQQPEDVQIAAAKVLVDMDNPEVVSILLKKWKGYSAPVREVVERSFLSDSDRLLALLDAVENGRVASKRLSRSARQQILNAQEQTISQKAKALFPDLPDKNYEDIILKYTPTVSATGDVAHGKTIYDQKCSICHRVGKQGFQVGPPLATVANRSKAYLLTQIVNPSAMIAPGYESYIIETTTGSMTSGVMAGQTPTSVTLRTAGGVENTVLRRTIESIRPLNLSWMPESLAEGMSMQDMADLLEYLKGIR